MPIQLWSQEIRLKWRPRASYFRLWPGILEDFERAGSIRGFQALPDSVSATLFDRNHRLDLGPSGLTASIQSPSALIPDMEAAVGLAAAHLDAPRLRGVEVALQHLAPLNMPYSDAKTRAAEGAFSDWVTFLSNPDFAVLIDGRRNDWSLQIEFGIVEATEIPGRLSHFGGRLEQIPMGDPSHWNQFQLPAVALFGTSRWRIDLAETESAVEGFVRLGAEARASGAALIAEILASSALNPARHVADSTTGGSK